MNHRTLRRVLATATGLGLLASPMALATEQSTNDYRDPHYASFDADNMARTGQRQDYHLMTPEYHEGSRETFADTWLDGMSRQNRDLDEGRVYAGLGQILPGGNVGDPQAHHEGPRQQVEFLNREGTKLVGNIWPCRDALDEQGEIAGAQGCPLVVVTTGSIQVTQHMYGWLARHLQDNGYTVFTYDVRGQGESETTDQQDPFGSNPQDGANFVAGTVDALRFALSTPSHPYVPVGWSTEEVEAARDADAATAESRPLDWFNPHSAAVLDTHIALVGHSAGASAVSQVQQCATGGDPHEVMAVVEATCNNETWGIRAVVAYDSLSAGSAGNPIVPVVPAFDHRADGYFINAVPSPTAPDPGARVDQASPYGKWRAAGVDALSITGRGFTHAEWSQIPYIVSATRYGVPQAKYYTLAWLDRYVHPDPERNRAGHEALATGPLPVEPSGQHPAHRASLFSGRYRSAISVSELDDRPAIQSADLRQFAQVAAVGDWAALNAETEYGTTPRGAVSQAVHDGG